MRSDGHHSYGFNRPLLGPAVTPCGELFLPGRQKRSFVDLDVRVSPPLLLLQFGSAAVQCSSLLSRTSRDPVIRNLGKREGGSKGEGARKEERRWREEGERTREHAYLLSPQKERRRRRRIVLRRQPAMQLLHHWQE